MDEVITITFVTADYRSRELPRIEHNVGDHGWQSNLRALFETMFGNAKANDFSPRKLQDIRDLIISRGNDRS